MPLPCTGSFQFLFAVLLDFVLREFLFRPAASSRRGRCCLGRLLRAYLSWSLDESRMPCGNLDDRKAHPQHKVSALEISVQVLKASDLGIHHQRHNVTFVVVTRRIPLPAHLPTRTALPQALDLDTSAGVPNPFRRVGLAGTNETLAAGL